MFVIYFSLSGSHFEPSDMFVNYFHKRTTSSIDAEQEIGSFKNNRRLSECSKSAELTTGLFPVHILSLTCQKTWMHLRTYPGVVI
jgi:hypothetical protein